MHLQGFRNIFYVCTATHPPRAFRKLLYLRRFRFFALLKQFAYQKLYEVVHSRYACHSAVFVYGYDKMHSRFLHFLAEGIGFHIFRHKKRFTQTSFQCLFLCQLLVPIGLEKLTHIEHSDNIVAVLPANRHIVMSGVFDSFFPVLEAVLCVNHYDIGSVCAKLFNGNIVEIQHILDHLVFFRVDHAFFTARSDHHSYFFFRHRFVLVRIYAHQLQNNVGRSSQQPYERLEYNRHHRQNSRNRECYLLSLVHSHTLWNQLAEYDAEICDYYRYCKHAYRVKYGFRCGHTCRHKFFDKRSRKVIRGICTSQKSR